MDAFYDIYELLSAYAAYECMLKYKTLNTVCAIVIDMNI